MSKQASTYELARLLMCSEDRATEFRNEVNWLLRQHTQRTASLEMICAAVSHLDRFTVTSHQVAEYIAGPTGTADSSPEHEATNGVEESEVLDSSVECTTNGEIDCSITGDEVSPCVLSPDETSSASGADTVIFHRQDVLERLTIARPDKVTYAQIEQAMVGAGLDPAVCEDDYLWLIDRLEQQGILVVDALDVGADAEFDPVTALQENRTEIDKILQRIFGHSPNRGSELLTAEEQLRLLEIVQQGKQATREIQDDMPEEIEDELRWLVLKGQQAFDQLLLHNQRLVVSVALQYAKHAHFLEVDDLVQEGMFGLARAIERFDFGVGTRLSTYAVWWIRQSISRSIADHDRTIRLPVHRIESLNAYLRAVADLEKSAQRAPTDIEIAGALRLLSPSGIETVELALHHDSPLPNQLQQQVHNAVKHVQYLRMLANAHLVSLDLPVGADGENSTLGDFLPDRTSPSPEQVAMTSSLREKLSTLLGGLSPRERAVLTYRFGLEDNAPETLEEVGRRFDVTRERIRQIEAKALVKLRHPVRSRHLRDYIDFTPKPHEETAGETTGGTRVETTDSSD